MTLKEACKHALTILKQVMEEKLNETNVEVRTHGRFLRTCVSIANLVNWGAWEV